MFFTHNNTTSSILILFVKSVSTAPSERRFDKGLSIQQLKAKLEPITGISPSNQRLLITPSSSASIETAIELTPDDAVLGSFHVENYVTLDVQSISPYSSSVNNKDLLNDLSAVPKYEMPDEKYDTRTDSVRHFKRMHKLGRFSDKPPTNSTDLNPEIQVGKRCQVFGQVGTIRYIGKVQNEGLRIGIELDEPLGEHDGEYKSVRYFNAKKKSGLLIPPSSDIIVGEFKEVDIFEELEEI